MQRRGAGERGVERRVPFRARADGAAPAVPRLGIVELLPRGIEVGWFLAAARLSSGGTGVAGRGWWLTLLPLAVIVVAAVGYGLRSGWARAGQTTLSPGSCRSFRR